MRRLISQVDLRITKTLSLLILLSLPVLVVNFSEPEKSVPHGIYHLIDEKAEVTKWTKEIMGVGLAIYRLLSGGKKRLS